MAPFLSNFDSLVLQFVDLLPSLLVEVRAFHVDSSSGTITTATGVFVDIENFRFPPSQQSQLQLTPSWLTGLISTMFPFNQKQKKIEQALEHCATEVDLRHQGLGNSEAGYLADVMKVNQTLQRIDLDGNAIGGYIFGQIESFLLPQEINLSENSIKCQGGGKLAEALKVNQTL